MESEPSDDNLRREAGKIKDVRRDMGLEGLTGDLSQVIIRVQENSHDTAVYELLSTTCYFHEATYLKDGDRLSLLKSGSGADICVISGVAENNPFDNSQHLAKSMPDTRLETFVFTTRDAQAYYEALSGYGVEFMTDAVVENEGFSFIQSMPSALSGNSIGVIEYHGGFGDGLEELDVSFEKPELDYLSNVGFLDHAASRVRACDRDAAILEFMQFTNYDFQFAIHVHSLNSITNVARLGKDDFAMVFTSGISDYVDDESSGPTEKFTHNWGPRTHHLAFITDPLEPTVDSLKRDGLTFLSPIYGSEAEGIKQIFSNPFKSTYVINEYLTRFGDFDGFFTPENVTNLTKATGKQ